MVVTSKKVDRAGRIVVCVWRCLVKSIVGYRGNLLACLNMQKEELCLRSWRK